uniref:ANK_REP_REGION domain-containing protein n=1 Tax=Heterorhabditis bacteriophora TaxID=37862 RepID=A0A1I7XMH8_HETBA
MDVLERTPLHAAAFAGFSACINVLLSIEAEDDCLVSPLVGWKDKERETALHVACARGRMDCVLALLKGGAALNAMNDRRKTPLQCALDNRHLHIVDYLRTQDALLPAELEQVAAKVASEQSMVSRVQEDIKSGMESINCMRSEMDMENWINTKDEAGSIDMLKAIESEIKRLQLLYDEKKKDQQELIDRIDLLAFRLGEDISELIPESKKLIASADVAVLQAKTVQMEGLLNERIKQSQEWQRDMRKYIKVMGDVLIQDDPNLKVIIDSDLSKDDFTLHNGMLSLIEGHWMQMRDMFSDWVQEKDFKWTELYGRLKELWNQCHVADIERLFPSSFDPDRHTDKDYNDMAKEIARLEALYAARQSVYDMLKT